ncbi:hypothetical protein ACFWG0_26495 [Streptomyces yangpuensis]|uniref:hypothetical protein n=1 Tax=Streptomyces yangpuensis TaxID=1648182 RepID=UPI003656F09F
MTDTAPAAVEYLYELWDANWDDGPLGNYKIHQYPITRKTSRRIYFSIHSRTGFVDRQRIEADGKIYHRPFGRYLHLTPPEIPGPPQRPSLSELKAAMAAAHPDRGGTDAEFITARQRYERARASA